MGGTAEIVSAALDLSLELLVRTVPIVVTGVLIAEILVSRWWGPESITTTVEEMDAKPGGTWRAVQRDTEGNEYAFHGIYHEVTPERINDTIEYETMPGHILLETEMIEDLSSGRTKVTDHLVFQSVENRDGMLQAGMEEKMTGTMERLAGFLQSLKQAVLTR